VGDNQRAVLVIPLDHGQVTRRDRHRHQSRILSHHHNVTTNRYGRAMTTDPRAALDRLIAALEAHLQAASRRTGEADPAVVTAYQTLADAFESYDEALYGAYDEVTPFVLYEDDADDEGDTDDEDDEDEDDLEALVDEDEDEDDLEALEALEAFDVVDDEATEDEADEDEELLEVEVAANAEGGTLPSRH
jgi:hypothetical protein